MKNLRNILTLRTFFYGIILLGLVAGFIWYSINYWYPAVDFHYQYYLTASKWIQGETILYDGVIDHFYQAPWTVWFLVLYGVWTEAFGLALLRITSLVALITGIFYFDKNKHPHPFVLAFALANFHIFDLLHRGQLDAITVAGITLAWYSLKNKKAWLLGTAYFLLMIKPPNSIPVAAFLFYLSLTKWNIKEIIKSLIPPIAVILLSLIVHPGWIGRWRTVLRPGAIQQVWPVTLWRIRDALHLPDVFPLVVSAVVLILAGWAWYVLSKQNNPKQDRIRLALVITTTFIVTPHALSYHYMILLAVVFPILANWRLWTAGLLYLLTYLPLVRLLYGPTIAWIDIAFPVTMFILVLIIIFNPSETTRARGESALQASRPEHP